MASLHKDQNGAWTLQATTPDKRRRTVRLGQITKRDAHAVKSHVEAIIGAMFAGQAPPEDTLRWLGRLTDALYQKLARAGLAAPRDASDLKAFLDGYNAKRGDVKASTLSSWEKTWRNLRAFFGDDKPLREITEGDAEDWRRWLVTHEKLAPATIGKRCQHARQFFAYAVRHRLIDRNPFEALKTTQRGNPKRFHFITREDAAKVLEACPDLQWRLIFALCRFGGLRCPSEIRLLRWEDIDWEHERITIHSPKTEHHVGGDSRVIPLFPELRPLLDEAFFAERHPSEFVVDRHLDRTTNLRTMFTKIVRRAGLKPWPKLFQNLRSTRQTELEESFPSHVVCAWIGNSERVAQRHYLQVTDAHFERASALQNALHGLAEMGGNSPKAQGADNRESQESPCILGNSEVSEERPIALPRPETFVPSGRA